MKQTTTLQHTQGFAAHRREALLLAVLALAGGAALAQSPAPSVSYNGGPLPTRHPVLEQAGALLLPMRDLCAALGAQVQWYPSERKIELRRGDHLVELWVRTPVAQVDHNPVQLSLPPLMKQGVTYLPLRLVGEAFGCQVRWDAGARAVSLSTTAP